MKKFLLGLLFLSGCLSVTTINVSQKTALEHQLMGEFEPLSEEQILVSSVRSAYLPESSPNDLTAKALHARKRQLFNRDEIDELKSQDCLRESFPAKLIAHACNAPVVTLIAEENADRAVVIQWLIAQNSEFTPNDTAKVAEMYHQLLFEKAKPKEWFELPKGVWKQK